MEILGARSEVPASRSVRTRVGLDQPARLKTSREEPGATERAASSLLKWLCGDGDIYNEFLKTVVIYI